MLPLRSKITPIDTGTSSDEKFTTSCSMLSSEDAKAIAFQKTSLGGRVRQ